MSEIREIASHFEAVKIAMTQDKNGFILKLSLHPNDTPEDVLRDPVGTRYTIALVRMNDQSEPVASPSTDDGIRAIKLAGTLCTDPDFQMWMVGKGYCVELTEDAVADGLRTYLGVASRKELKTDADARSALGRLRDDFVAEYRGGR